MRKLVVFWLFIFLFFVPVFNTAKAAGTTVVVDWNNAALSEIRKSKLGPPIVARELAIVHTCIYDAWTVYDKKAVGAVFNDKGQMRQPSAAGTDANKKEAVSFAAYRCLLNLFPDTASQTRLTAVMQGLGYNPNNTVMDSSPAGIGNQAAANVIASRLHDGSNQYGDLNPGAYTDYTGYQSVNSPLAYCIPTLSSCPPFQVTDPLRWQPLTGPPELGSVVQKFVGAQWEKVIPFAITSASEFDNQIPDPEIFKSQAAYKKSADDILALSAQLDNTRKLFIEYWADGPASELPAGHWGLLAQFVSQRDHNTLDQDVKMFFAMHMASADAGIVGWHIKRKYDGVRPITAIRYLYNGQIIRAWGGPGRPIENIKGETWSPYNPGSNLTPSFPGYLSGHAIYSAASSGILRRFTGDDDTFNFSTVIPANFGRVETGIPAVATTIKFKTFSEAAQSASDSRIWSGIHFRDDCTVGLSIGEIVAKRAWDRAQNLFSGKTSN